MNFDYFQYPVHSEVEKESKFGSFVVSGVIFWPYRRICFLNNEQFKNFVDNVSKRIIKLWSLILMYLGNKTAFLKYSL